METNVNPVPGFTVEQINKAIESMARTQQTAVNSISRVIVMAVWASTQDKDQASVANTLMANLRKSAKKSAVIACLEGLGNLAYISGGFQYFDAGVKWTEKSAKEIKGAAASWENFKAAPTVSRVDAAAALDDLVQKLMKASQKSLLDHAALLVRIQALNAEIQGELVFEDVAETQGTK